MSDSSQNDADPDLRAHRMAFSILHKQLDEISVNPFVNHWNRNNLKTLYFYTFGLFMIIIKGIPFCISILASTMVAKLFVHLLQILTYFNYKPQTIESIRDIGRDVVFALIRVALFFCGFYWIRIVDKRLDKDRMAPIIPCAPHSSFFDIIIILKIKNPVFVAREDNIHLPLIGNIFKLCNGIYVDRKDKDSRMTTIRRINERTAQGGQVLIFPEGTCANRTALVQFKVGAFLPRLPVQPVLLRFDQRGDHDSITWSWEGPGPYRILMETMSKLYLNCELTILPEYQPNEQEKSNPLLFANNVAKVMCMELGILQSFYSYDDVPFQPVARTLRLFRSPVCIIFLKIAEKIAHRIIRKEDQNDPKNQQQHDDDNNKKKDAGRTSLTSITSKQDFKHLKETIKKNITQLFSKSKSKVPNEPNSLTSSNENLGQEEQFQYLPISETRRKLFKTHFSQFYNFHDYSSREMKQLYETFCRLIEHCITSLEQDFVPRPIESTDDLINLLKLNEFVENPQETLNKSVRQIFDDLLNRLQMSVPIRITTVHLLIVLHLSDVRELDLWERIRVAVQLFDRIHHMEEDKRNSTQTPYKYDDDEHDHFLNISDFRTIVWYTLGLNEFNDYYFIQNRFDFEYLKENLARLFWRAVNENAPQLIE